MRLAAQWLAEARRASHEVGKKELGCRPGDAGSAQSVGPRAEQPFREASSRLHQFGAFCVRAPSCWEPVSRLLQTVRFG
eukprot:4643073-Alexandrium_andersonii.AAC.1